MGCRDKIYTENQIDYFSTSSDIINSLLETVIFCEFVYVTAPPTDVSHSHEQTSLTYDENGFHSAILNEQFSCFGAFYN